MNFEEILQKCFMQINTYYNYNLGVVLSVWRLVMAKLF